MKKQIALLILLCLTLFCFASCYLIKENSDDNSNLSYAPDNDGHDTHTFEYIQYETGHFKQFTCGCPSPEIMGMHTDDNNDGICDLCNYLMEKKDPEPEGSEGSEDRDPNAVYLSDHYTFLKTVKADEIAAIETMSEDLGAEPGSLKIFKSSTDKDLIINFIRFYSSVKLQPIDEPSDEGYSKRFVVTFIYNGGLRRYISFYDRTIDIYSNKEVNYYKPDTLLDFLGEAESTTSYEFISSVGTGKLCSYDPIISSAKFETICHLPLEEIRFVKGAEPEFTEENRRDLALVTEFGNLYFVTPTIFAHYSIDGYCELVGSSIDELLEKYKPKSDELLLSDKEPWLNEVTADDIKEVKTVRFDSLSGSNFTQIKKTSNKSIINAILDDYRIVKLDDSYAGFEPTADEFSIEFYMKDGSVERIFFTGGCWYAGCLCDVVPSLDMYNYKDVEESYILRTYGIYSKIYHHSFYSSQSEGVWIGRINPEMIEFRECDGNIDDGLVLYFYYFDTSVGRVNIYNECYLSYDGVLYEIVNSDNVRLSDYALLKEAREGMYNDGRVAFVEYYLGRYESGAVVGMITDDKTSYTEALWREKVGDYGFQYYDGNRIVVLYEGEFYTLTEAYENGYLTDSDLMNIWLIF